MYFIFGFKISRPAFEAQSDSCLMDTGGKVAEL
jgi:hypothetical protein